MDNEERPEWLRSEPKVEAAPLPIRDRYLDLPKRTKVINDDDITNLKISLNTAHTIEELINQL